jgi:hypothetical protein
MSDEVLAVDLRRRNNADLIADAARLGWFDGAVLDATFNAGRFWRKYWPSDLTTNDLDPSFGADLCLDWTDAGFAERVGRTFDAVVFDPPYKLSGTPRLASDWTYGRGEKRPSDKVIDDLFLGLWNCARVVKPNGLLLVKVQDAVSGGKVVSLTSKVIEAVGSAGWAQVGMLHLVTAPRKQPRRQVTPRNNMSTLLVFRKPNRRQPGAGTLW